MAAFAQRRCGVSIGTAEQHGSGLRGALAALRRSFAPADHLALWTLTLDGAVAGSLMREGDRFRLSLFGASADDLASLARDAADLPALEGALSRRLGGAARFHAVAA
jgi:hypothetical protein